MDWVEGMRRAICYMEENMAGELSIDGAARAAGFSVFIFQRVFSMLCGFPAGEYIRRRRLALAGSELLSTGSRITDIALKYGYDSPDSFTRAFTRFHGVTPTAVRRDGAMLKSFAPLKIIFILEGGSMMDYKIVEKEAFTVVGVSRKIAYESSFADIPRFWKEHAASEKGKLVCGMFGICLDSEAPAKEFDYWIADNYLPWDEIPEGLHARTFSKGSWAVFPCRGAMPDALQSVNRKIFSEWLPNCQDYEMAGSYNIELYTSPDDYPNGTGDEQYYSEIWIPVRKR